MYRIQRSPGFNYTCGLYQQSHTQSCDHNHVDGPLATKFALSCVQQILMRPGFADRLREKLQRLAEQSTSDSSQTQELKRLQSQLVLTASDRKKAAKNMALADSQVQSSAMKEVFDELMQREHELTRQIESLAGSVGPRTPEEQIDQLMRVVENLQDLAKNTDDLAAVGHLFGQLNLRLFFQFQQVQLKKRFVNRVAGGQVTFGNAAPPVDLYAGRTDTQSVKSALCSVETLEINSVSDEEVNSLRNVNRGDRI